MTTPRALRPIVRLTPLLASLVICAFATPRAAAAGCAHPADARSSRASASLQILEIADRGGVSWSLPGVPCNGPRCRSKAPAADAPVVLIDAVARHEALSSMTAPSTAPCSILVARFEPPLNPTDAPLVVERPPRGV